MECIHEKIAHVGQVPFAVSPVVCSRLPCINRVLPGGPPGPVISMTQQARPVRPYTIRATVSLKDSRAMLKMDTGFAVGTLFPSNILGAYQGLRPPSWPQHGI